MKITDMIVHPMAMPAERVRWTAQEITQRVELTLIEIRTDAGLVGIGEISTGPQAVVAKLLADLAPILKGRDALAIDDIWNLLFSITVPRPGGLGGWDGLPAPLSRNLHACAVHDTGDLHQVARSFDPIEDGVAVADERITEDVGLVGLGANVRVEGATVCGALDASETLRAPCELRAWM